MKFFGWFSAVWRTRSAEAGIRRTDSRISGMEREIAAAQADLSRRESELNSRYAAAVDKIAGFQRLLRQYESTLDELREKNRVHEMTIQTLVAQHKLILERVDADTAIAVRARVAASVKE